MTDRKADPGDVLREAGIASNVAPRVRGARVPPLPARPSEPPEWRASLMTAKAKTSLRATVAERPTIVSVSVKVDGKLEPDAFLKLPNLGKVQLSVIDSSRLPAVLQSLSCLEHLVWLKVQGRLSTLPPDIAQLRGLRRLEVPGQASIQNGVERLPEEVGSLEHLEELMAPRALLAELPDAIARLSALRWLDLGGNPRLARLPASFGALAALRGVDLQSPNALEPEAVFAVLSAAPRLRLLRLRGEWSALPATVGTMTSLAWLTVGGRLEALPEAIERLGNLRSLDVEFNLLRVLPEAVAAMPRLERLNVFQNPRLDVGQTVRVAAKSASLRLLQLPPTGLTDDDVRVLRSAGFAQSSGPTGDVWVRGEGPVVSWREIDVT